MESIVLEPLIDDFYYAVQKCMMLKDEEDKLKYVSSRSTKENVKFIEEIIDIIKEKCEEHEIPMEGNLMYKNEKCINAFKYLVCNTNYESQSLLSEDLVNGFMVDIQPSFSPYLLIEILLGLNFEDVLVESILHFPLDLCIDMLKDLPRCMDILEFDRELKLLISVISNVYMKILLMRDVGTQTNDINSNTKNLLVIVQELIGKFENKRFMKLDGLSQSDTYRRQGVVLKNIVRMSRICLTSKKQYQELKFQNLEKLYKLTFGRQPFNKLDDPFSEECFTLVRTELVSILLSRLKEIDVDTYMNWAEHSDDENSSFTLQRGIGLECHFFIETIKASEHIDVNKFSHLIQCIENFACQPDPKHESESFTLAELIQGIQNKDKECLMTLFKRYKEWNNSIIESIDDHLDLLDKNDCLELVSNIVIGLDNSPNEEHEKSLYFLYLGKALALLDVKDLFDFSINCILRFGCDESFSDRLDIRNFSKFVTHHLPINSPRSLRVVLFYLSLKTIDTLKILIKLCLEHSDYPHVSLGIDELKILLPILKIRTDETESLAVRVLREICMDEPSWNFNKFSKLLQFYNTFCPTTEIVDKVLTSVIESDKCSVTQTKQALTEIRRFKDTYQSNSQSLIELLAKRVLPLRRDTKLKKFEIEEPVNLAFELAEHFLGKGNSFPRCNTLEPLDNLVFNPYLWDIDLKLLPKLKMYSLKQVFGTYCSKLHLKYSLKDDTSFILIPHGSKVIDQDDVLRHLISRCTKREFIHYTEELLSYFGPILKWRNKTNIVDNIIRLTLETCLLFLEFPFMASPDILEFLVKCLSEFYFRLGNEFFQVISESTLSHINMLTTSIAQTRIKEAFNELLDYCKSSNLQDIITALQKFGDSCTEKSNNLKTFQGCRSQKAIRMFLGYKFVNESLSKAMTDDELKQIFQKCFSPIS